MRPAPETIRSLVAFVEKEGLEEVCYEAGAVRIRVRKEAIAVAAGPAVPMVAQEHPVAPPETKPSPPASSRLPVAHGLRDLLSPIAGIFYRTASPGGEPFVKEGDRVDAGQTVGLVEAMKTFNEVAAEFPGMVVEFHVQNAEAVQRGQPLLALELLEVEV